LPDIELIDTASALNELCDALEKAELVALDTEFVRESTYFAELCLIQLATDKLAVCVDCCAGLDLKPLFARILSADVRLLAHSGRQDLELLVQAAGRLPPRLLDTQIAAGLLGHPPQIGLRELLIARLDIEIEKSLSRTDWRKRPISDSALEYAATDVLHLIDLWRSLAQELAQKGRMDWFDEDCARALTVELEPGLATLFQRTRGTGRLRGRHTRAALALLEWREQAARAANRPRRWILRDEVLVELAAAMPSDVSSLGRISALAAKTRARHGAALVAAIGKADAARFKALEEQCGRTPRPDPDRLRELQTGVQAAARSLGIEPELIATRRDVVAAALGEPPEHLVRGWRSTVLAAAG
jgi:ribonuclease D